MTTARFPVLPLPPGAQERAGPLRAAFARAITRLPFGLALLAAVYVSSALGTLVRNPALPFRAVLFSETWLCVMVSDTFFVACILLAVLVADEAVARGARRPLAYGCALVAGCGAGAWAQARLIGALGWTAIPGLPADMLAMQPLRLFFYALIYGTFGCFVYVNHRTARLAAQRMRDAELARARSRRRTLESRLQAMQARVEPQFLFNTLAHVCDLYERDPRAAGRMLDDLIAYLRAALPHLRESSSTLGREIELARAYVDIVRARMADGPSLEVVLPAQLAQQPVPAMTLLPLIDQALARRQRGDDAGGAIRIECETQVVRLRITFVDDGTGAHAAPPTLADAPPGLSERLHALYGREARVDVEHTRAGGLRAVVEIPLVAAPPHNQRGP